MKFQAATLDQRHRLLINLSCKSASKPLNAQHCTWARSDRGRHYDRTVARKSVSWWRFRVSQWV